jgi:hypothetical protein
MSRINVLFIAQFPYTWHGTVVDRFYERGCSCAVLSPKGVCETSSAEHFNLMYKLIDLPFALEHACQEFNPDLIIPLDDLSALQLRGLWRSRWVSSETNHRIENSIGNPESFYLARDRVAFTAEARRLGVLVPGGSLGIDFPFIAKWGYSTGGYGTRLVKDEEDLLAVYSPGIRRRVRNYLGYLFYAFDRYEPIEFQSFVPGTAGMYTLAAKDGEVLDGAGFIATSLSDEFGSAIEKAYIDHHMMRAQSAIMVKSLGLSGLVSFDFILDGGKATMIEMNPRTIQAALLAPGYGHDIIKTLIEANL